MKSTMNNIHVNEEKVDAVVDMSEISTTKFIGDGEEINLIPSNDVPIHSGLIEQTVDAVPLQDIKTILSRPVRLRAGVLSASTSGLMHFGALPSEMLAVPMYAEKTKGFLSFRARMRITLQVNANRFALGRLILGYMPAATIRNSYPYNRMLNKQQITALPHVELDVGTKSSCAIDIPFVNNYLYYDLSTNAITATDCGAFFVYVYSPYDPGNGTNADYTIWANFEDVDIAVPAYKFQMGFSNMSDKELKSAGKVTRFSSYVGKAASVFKDSGMPIISSIAGTASWFSDLIGNVAYTLGWSKPIDEKPSESVTIDVYDKLQHVDGISKSKKLSLFSNNKVDVLPGCSYTDCDETNIKYLAGISSYISSFNWSESATAGSLLAVYNVSPLIGQTDVSTTLNAIVNTCYTMTPLTFVTQFFRFWRGSLTFTFKFVKTEFHTGRLAFVFFPSPSTDNSGSIPGFDSTHYNLREIVDIHGATEYTVTIPYVSNKVTTDALSQLGTGYLAIYVVNPLVSTSTVANNIQVLVEHAGGSDLEFYGYVPRNGSDNFLFTPNVPTVINDGQFVSQMDIGSKMTDSTNVIGNSTLKTNVGLAARYVAGEQIESLNSLMKMTSLCTKNNGIPNPWGSIILKPFEIWGYTRTATDWQIPYFTGDLFSTIASCYAYNRGSINYTLIDKTNNLYKWTAFLLNVNTPSEPLNLEFDPITTLYGRCGQPVAISSAEYNAGITVNVPPYSSALLRTPRINGTTILSGGPAVSSNRTSDNFNSPYRLFLQTTQMNAFFELGRSAGDDFQVSSFWGIPPMSKSLL